MCVFSPRALSAQNPPLQQHPALDAELLGHLDQRVPTHLQRQALPQPQTQPQEARAALQTDVLHGIFPTATGETLASVTRYFVYLYLLIIQRIFCFCHFGTIVKD